MTGWRAADLAHDTGWRVEWTAGELRELAQWACPIEPRALEENPALLHEALEDAPPTLLERAEEIRRELLEGRGVVLISGIDVQSAPPDELAVRYLLFAALVGSLRSQNAAGHLLGHVIDVGADYDDPNTRIYQTNRRQTFHTDSTDAVGLLCLRTAREGGESMVVSVDAVYRRMLAEEPDLAARLFDPIATDRRGEQPEGQRPWFEIPVLSTATDGRVTGLYQRQYVDSASRFDDAPRPDAQHVAALDLFDEIMNDPTMHVRMELAPGDIQFVHNHSVLHDRTGWIDHADPALRRYLLRVWLSLPGDRELPATFAQRYGSITVGDRGGITTPSTTPTVQLPSAATA